jgi:predicted secreted hydrolase
MELSLILIPRKPLVFHGENGLSQKGMMQGQASYYSSFTDLEAKGLVKTPLSQNPIHVNGISWFDHEFGSNQLTPNQAGWDWFSLHLSDGRDLMIYFLRRKDGTIEPSSSGTLITPSGDTFHLKLPDISIEVLDHWKSPKSGGRYPSRWRIKIPFARIEMEISSLVPSQELLTEGSTGVIYWEGAVAGKGTSGGKPITCEGYVELTGYAGSLGGLF